MTEGNFDEISKHLQIIFKLLKEDGLNYMSGTFVDGWKYSIRKTKERTHRRVNLS